MNISYLLVLLGVVMVSYSGPLVTLAIQYGANPATIAMMRMKSFRVERGRSSLESSWESIRIMASLMNSEGWMV